MIFHLTLRSLTRSHSSIRLRIYLFCYARHFVIRTSLNAFEHFLKPGFFRHQRYKLALERFDVITRLFKFSFCLLFNPLDNVLRDIGTLPTITSTLSTGLMRRHLDIRNNKPKASLTGQLNRRAVKKNSLGNALVTLRSFGSHGKHEKKQVLIVTYVTIGISSGRRSDEGEDNVTIRLALTIKVAETISYVF